MSETLGDFHTEVADSMSRGASLPSAIQRRTRLSARWIERNYCFQYMRSWLTLNVLADATYPHILSIAGLELRAVETLRIRRYAENNDVVYDQSLKQVKPEDRTNRPNGVRLESYWLNGVSSLVLNQVPDEDMTLEGHFQIFTKWGTANNWTHWLLDNAWNLLLARTMMMMTSRTRDPDLWNIWKQEFDLELQSFKVSEEDLTAGEPVLSQWEPPEQIQDDSSLRNAN